jgi:GGDEF domain-containing protein
MASLASICNVGSVFLECDGEDVDRRLLLQQADRALYRAKEKGRDRIEISVLQTEALAPG